jgi:hypothetical protein
LPRSSNYLKSFTVTFFISPVFYTSLSLYMLGKAVKVGQLTQIKKQKLKIKRQQQMFGTFYLFLYSFWLFSRKMKRKLLRYDKRYCDNSLQKNLTKLKKIYLFRRKIFLKK